MIKIKCSECGHRFMDNPKKHEYRAKLCPHCRTPYSKGKSVIFKVRLPSIRDLQQMFNFFPKLDRRNIYYQCPSCKFKSDIIDELTITKWPEKTKEVIIKGIPQQIPITYRDIVTCPKCKTFMTRKRGFTLD